VENSVQLEKIAEPIIKGVAHQSEVFRVLGRKQGIDKTGNRS
jgi:hypothetical protein